MTDGVDVTPEDALQIAQRAMQRISDLEQEVDELRAENDALRERVVALEVTHDDHDSYPDDRDARVGMVRQHLVERAQDQHGKAAIDYSDIKFGVFDGEPSAGHCYDLMQRAARVEGFSVRNESGQNKQLVVDLDAVKEITRFSRVNKDAAEGELP